MPPALVEVDDVVVRYGSHVALDGVSARIDAPATGLLGANGAGKSTLMKAVLGLLVPTRGTVRVLGEEATRAGGIVRRRVGYMPEHECLPPSMTAADLVVHLAELRGARRRDGRRGGASPGAGHLAMHRRAQPAEGMPAITAAAASSCSCGSSASARPPSRYCW